MLAWRPSYRLRKNLEPAAALNLLPDTAMAEVLPIHTASSRAPARILPLKAAHMAARPRPKASRGVFLASSLANSAVAAPPAALLAASPAPPAQAATRATDSLRSRDTALRGTVARALDMEERPVPTAVGMLPDTVARAPDTVLLQLKDTANLLTEVAAIRQCNSSPRRRAALEARRLSVWEELLSVSVLVSWAAYWWRMRLITLKTKDMNRATVSDFLPIGMELIEHASLTNGVSTQTTDMIMDTTTDMTMTMEVGTMMAATFN